MNLLRRRSSVCKVETRSFEGSTTISGRARLQEDYRRLFLAVLMKPWLVKPKVCVVLFVCFYYYYFIIINFDRQVATATAFSALVERELSPQTTPGYANIHMWNLYETTAHFFFIITLLFVTNHHCWYCLSRICSVVKGERNVTKLALYLLYLFLVVCFMLLNNARNAIIFCLIFLSLKSKLSLLLWHDDCCAVQSIAHLMMQNGDSCYSHDLTARWGKFVLWTLKYNNL